MARKSWDRLDKEGDKAYLAFTFYRDLPAEDNSLAKAEMLYRKAYNKDIATLQRTRIASKTITNWSVRHRWVKRRRDYWGDIEKRARAKNERIRVKEIAEAKKSMRQTARLSQSVAELAAGIGHLELKNLLTKVNNKTTELEMKDLIGLINSAGKASKSAVDTWQVLEPDDFKPKQQLELSWGEKLDLEKEVDPQQFLDDMDALLLSSLEVDDE